MSFWHVQQTTPRNKPNTANFNSETDAGSVTAADGGLAEGKRLVGWLNERLLGFINFAASNATKDATTFARASWPSDA
jgi:hypothetical protein